ncbi:MAG: MoaD/ThiS family protein [Polyangia bacterium]|jgi:molybdopterin converting factor small subunit|nr:MoaD/ThiS family protein [Polyangia bacterium]
MAIFKPHAKLAALLGEPTIRSEAATVGELLDEVQSRVSPEDWKRASKATILVNGRSVHYLKGMRTPLGADDQVWMVYPASGG